MLMPTDFSDIDCAQLAGKYQPDADALTMWYSGWYNGLAKKHFLRGLQIVVAVSKFSLTGKPCCSQNL
jgi:hypothetical protein